MFDDLFANAAGGAPEESPTAPEESPTRGMQWAADAVRETDWPAACRFEGELDGCLFVSFLTVPDVERFPVPPELTAGKIPVDLDGAEEWGLAQVRAVISPTLPDDQLETLWANENGRSRPRAGLMKPLSVERERRAGAYPAWVAAHASSLTRGRVAAVASALGYAEPVVEVCLTPEDEAAAFANLRCVERESVAVWDLQLLRLAGVRALRLDPQASTLHGGFLRTSGLSASGVESPAELLAAVDVLTDPQADACEVFAAAQADMENVLEQYAVQRLDCERRAMLASWRV